MSGVQMSLGTVVKKVKTFAKEIWGLDFDIKIEISTKMTSAFGYVRYKKGIRLTQDTPILMKIAARLLNGDYKEETIDSVLLHETCHWAMMKLNKPHRDGDYYFESELRRIGASSTRVLSGAGETHTFKCTKCGKLLEGINDRQAKNILTKINKSVSRCCRAKIEYVGKFYKSDDNEIIKGWDEKISAIKTAASISTPTIEKIPTFEQPVLHNLKGIIEVPVGPHGKITNNTFLDTIKKLIKENNLEGIAQIIKSYPKVFESSFKYLGKREQEIVRKVG